MPNKIHRTNHIFREDKKTFIMAMDHGNGFNVLPAMKYPGKIISEVARAGADAFLATVGLADKFADSFHGKGIILRLDGSCSFIGSKDKPLQTVVGIEDAVRLGADAVISMGFPGSKWEDQILENLSRNIMDCNKWNLPLVAEMLPRGFEGGEDSRTPENITFACRMGAEMGADIIKTEYTGSPESFHELCESVYVPVVILGVAWWRAARDGTVVWQALSSALMRFSAPLLAVTWISAMLSLPKQYGWLFLFDGVMFLVLDALGTGDDLPLSVHHQDGARA